MVVNVPKGFGLLPCMAAMTNASYATCGVVILAMTARLNRVGFRLKL
jgi:hypothetical protein